MQWHGKVVSITRDPLDDAMAHCHAVMARGSVADSHADSPRDSHAARPDPHTPGAWPEPYDPAPDSDSEADSLNTGFAARPLNQIRALAGKDAAALFAADVAGEQQGGTPGIGG